MSLKHLGLYACLFFSLFFANAVAAQTQVIMLGTGTPVPDATRSGPGVAIITNGKAYIFDAGGGMVKKATEASIKMNIAELNPQDIEYLFLTHLHTDHIHDVSELASRRWWARPKRLQIWGPKGLKDYTDNMVAMMAIEADIRAVGTPQQLITDREAYRVISTEIEDGIVFQNDDISVEAFTVPHGEIRPAFGYKVITEDKTIVISGDTSFSELLAEKAKGADILIHEIISGERLAEQSEFWQLYHGSSHTTADKVAEVASIAQPKLLVLYHILFYGATAEEIVNEVKHGYSGEVVLANDLDVF